MKTFTRSAIVICSVLVVSLFVSYGTLSPCGVLSKQLRSDSLHTIVDQTSTTNEWEMAGTGLGAALIGPMIDSFIGSLTPMECLNGLVKYHTSDENILSEKISSRLDRHSEIGNDYSISEDPIEPIKPKWHSFSDQSPIDDSTNMYLYIDANETVSGWLKENITPSLKIMCKENKTYAFVDIGMRPQVGHGNYGTKYSYVRLRYDDEKAFKKKFILSTDGKALFFPRYIPTVKKMLKHERLLIEFTPYNSSPQISTFNLAGLESKIGPLREACHW